MLFELLLLCGRVALNQESPAELILVCDKILIIESLVMSLLHHFLRPSSLCHFYVKSEICRDKLAGGQTIINVAAKGR
jgi:hypothetical protein